MGIYRSLLGLAMKRPDAWLAMVGMGWGARRRGWWRRFPFLPLPPASYLRWRSDTAWGDPEAESPDALTLRYLRWARHMRSRRRG
jgi:hypothetical protein